MHPSEIDRTLQTMKIYVDSREQQTKQSERRYQQFGCPWERHKLNFGDYSAVFTLPNGEAFSLENRCCVERKYALDELCLCFTHDRGRFEREFERAKEAGARLYLLVENGTYEHIYSGSYRSNMKPQALIASMLAWMARYDCKIVMPKTETSGRLIHDILFREAKEVLTKLEI